MKIFSTGLLAFFLVLTALVAAHAGNTNGMACTNNTDTGYYYFHKHHSLKSGMIRSVIKIIGFKKRSGHADESAKEKLRSFTTPTPPAQYTKHVQVTDTLFMGQHVYTLTPAHPNGKYILYLHGGAFVLSFIKPHWRFMQQLARYTGCTIIAPDYPLSPEHDYKERFNMLEPLYEAMVAKAGGDSIIVIGDSSGGNLALALAQQMKKKNEATPQQVILLSPWLDVSMTNPDIAAADKRDPLLSANGSRFVGRIHAGKDSSDLKNEMISPLYGPLKDIGKISIFTGTDDVLNPDAEKLRHIAIHQGIAINFFEYRRMIHTFMLFKMPEGKLARCQIFCLINNNGNR